MHVSLYPSKARQAHIDRMIVQRNRVIVGLLVLAAVMIALGAA